MAERSQTLNPFENRSFASLYDGWFESPAGRLVDRLETALIWRLAQPRPGERALDVGTGTGHFACKLAQSGLQVTGLDSSEAMLDVARAKDGTIEFCFGDATSLPFPDGSFELVLSVTALEFIREPALALAEMYRVTAPGGRLVVGTLNARSAMGRAYMREAKSKATPFRQARFCAPDEFVAELQALGPSRWASSVFFGTSTPQPWVAQLSEWAGQRLWRGHGALLVGRVDR